MAITVYLNLASIRIAVPRSEGVPVPSSRDLYDLLETVFS